MKNIKFTIYFIVTVLLVFLISSLILINMNKIIPNYKGELFTYNNSYSNKNNITEGISLVNRYLDEDNYYEILNINDLETYLQNKMINNLIDYCNLDSNILINKRIAEANMVPNTVFGDIICLNYGYPTTYSVSDNNKIRIHRFTLYFSKDYKNIYYNWFDNDPLEEPTEKSIDNIIEEVLKILQELKITEFISFNPESIWLSEMKNNTYIIKDNVNNIEVHYNTESMRITGLIIGFETD